MRLMPKRLQREKIKSYDYKTIYKEIWMADGMYFKTGQAMCVDVGFADNEGREDETQMDINAFDEQELSRLFADLCKENKFPINTVTYVTIVQIADVKEELLYG